MATTTDRLTVSEIVARWDEFQNNTWYCIKSYCVAFNVERVLYIGTLDEMRECWNSNLWQAPEYYSPIYYQLAIISAKEAKMYFDEILESM